jgi:UDP-glucose 4-epimerase
MSLSSHPTVLITGGAGYIGSHMVKYLQQRGIASVVIDDLSTGHHDAILTPFFYHADFADPNAIDEIIQAHHIDCVMHFAGLSDVCASMTQSDNYIDSNVTKTQQLLDYLCEKGIMNVVFSSSAAVYGQAKMSLIPETHPLQPINPYGQTKQQAEALLAQYHQTHQLNCIRLRYFNAAGADPSGELGERHTPETHLIPLVLQAAKQQTPIHLFGDNYVTPDGSCIRDYVHVWDVCAAHYLAMQSLLKKSNQCEVYNVGSGCGYSVREIIDAARTVTGCPIEVVVAPPRAGDPARLVADNQKIQRQLGWRPERTSLPLMLEDAWRFYQRHRVTVT